MRCILGCLVAFFCICPLRVEAQRAYICSLPPPTLLETFLEAPMVVVGRLHNAVAPNNALPNGQTELLLDDILVPHAIIKDRKSILLNRYSPSKAKYLVAMDIYKGEVDPYRSTELDAQGEVERYVRGGLKLKDKSALGRMRYSIGFLHSSSETVVSSARGELIKADYKDIRKVAESLKPEPFLKSLQKQHTERFEPRLGMDAWLLGHCGKKEHAVLLKKLIDDRIRNHKSVPVDYLFSYVLLEPNTAWNEVVNLAEQKDLPFLFSYSAFSAIRMIGNERQDVCDRKKCTAAMVRVLNRPDVADFAVDTLRKWQRWECAELILELPGKAEYKAPVIWKTVLCFALQCPTVRTANYVDAQRKLDPERVADMEELLRIEKE